MRKEEDVVQIIPMWRAVLCVECGCLSNTKQSSCPACGDGPLMNLRSALSGETKGQLVLVKPKTQTMPGSKATRALAYAGVG